MSLLLVCIVDTILKDGKEQIQQSHYVATFGNGHPQKLSDGDIEIADSNRFTKWDDLVSRVRQEKNFITKVPDGIEFYTPVGTNGSGVSYMRHPLSKREYRKLKEDVRK